MAGFLPGEQVCVRDLLYGTLLPSGADAAVTLACRVSGSEEAFVKLMNEKARSLGMTHTHFTNATGLHNDSHVTTLDDLALLLEYALDNGVFYRIFTAHQYQSQPTSMHPQGMMLSSTLFEKMGEGGESGVDGQGVSKGSGVILAERPGILRKPVCAWPLSPISATKDIFSLRREPAVTPRRRHITLWTPSRCTAILKSDQLMSGHNGGGFTHKL